MSPLTGIPADYDGTLQKLVNADAQIESLKEQLDATLGAEDMLERLTERNLTMQEVRALGDYHTVLTVGLENRRDADRYRGFGSAKGTQRRA